MREVHSRIAVLREVGCSADHADGFRLGFGVDRTDNPAPVGVFLTHLDTVRLGPYRARCVMGNFGGDGAKQSCAKRSAAARRQHDEVAVPDLSEIRDAQSQVALGYDAVDGIPGNDSAANARRLFSGAVHQYDNEN